MDNAPLQENPFGVTEGDEIRLEVGRDFEVVLCRSCGWTMIPLAEAGLQPGDKEKLDDIMVRTSIPETNKQICTKCIN